MNILFLIGNGFDLNLGMKTGYNDFYSYYQGVESKINSIIELKNNISEELKNWSDLELAIGEYTAKLKSIDEFDTVFDDIGDKLADYLQEEEDVFDLSKIDKEKILDYLSYPERALLPADKERLILFKDKWKGQHWNVNIITFNYTKTLEKIIGDAYDNMQIGHHENGAIMLRGIEHIHGYVKDRMVIGVNDISQIANKSFHKNQDILEAVIKSNCNQAHKHTIDELCEKQIRKANLICVFGSSIGETDNLWWSKVGKQLASECKLIIFYKSADIPPNRGYKKGREERKVIESFLRKTDFTEEEKKIISQSIYIGTNTEMFKMTNL